MKMVEKPERTKLHWEQGSVTWKGGGCWQGIVRELGDDVRENLTLQKLWGQGREQEPPSPSASLPRGARLTSKSGL